MSKKASEENPTVFVSRGLVALVKTPRRRIRDEETGEFYTKPGERFEFVDSGDGQMGRLAVTDPEDVEWLKNHRLFEATGHPDGHFVELGNEPGRVPSSSEDGTLDAIVDAIAEKDGDKLAALYVSERHSQSRPEVLAAAKRGLEKLDEDVPPPPDPPLHELFVQRAGGVEHYPGEGSGPAPALEPTPQNIAIAKQVLAAADDKPVTADDEQAKQDNNQQGDQSSSDVAFASTQAEEAAEGRDDLKPGGGSGKDGAYTVADLKD